MGLELPLNHLQLLPVLSGVCSGYFVLVVFSLNKVFNVILQKVATPLRNAG